MQVEVRYDKGKLMQDNVGEMLYRLYSLS